MAKIGVQAMMLKDSFEEIGPFETLRKVSAIGYNAVEISQIPMTAGNVAELDRSRSRAWHGHGGPLRRHGNARWARPGDSLRDHFDKIVDDAKRLDSRLLRIGMLPFPAMQSIGAVIDFAKQANGYAERLQEHGIGLYYHNHHIEFAKFDGKYMLDIIADELPGHGDGNRRALGPARRPGPGPDHQQVRRPHGHGAPEGLPDRRDCPSRPSGCCSPAISWASWQEFKNVVQFAEVGEGNLDFPSIIPPRRPPAHSTCWWNRTSSTAAPCGTPCRPRTTTWWPWATRTSSDSGSSHPTTVTR